MLKQYPTWTVTIEGHCDERGTRRVQSGIGRTARGRRARLPRLARHSGRSAAHGQLRQGIPVRSGPRRGGVGEEPPRALRHHREVSVMTIKTFVRRAARWRSLLGARRRRAACGRRQGTPADDGRHPHAAGAVAAAAEHLLDATLNEAIKAVNTRLDEQTEREPQGVRRPEAGRSTPGQRPARRPREGGRQQRARRIARRRKSTRCGSRSSTLSAPRAVRPTPPAPTRRAAAPDTGAAAARPPAPRRVGASPQEAAATARCADYYAGQYDLAILGLRVVRQDASRNRRQADDAQVHVGDSYLQRGKNDKAVEAYDLGDSHLSRRATSFPRRTAKKGLALKNLKQSTGAREAFEYVVKNYPPTPTRPRAGAAAAEPTLKLLAAPTPERVTLDVSSKDSPMGSVNKVILVGNLGRDAELRYTPGGAAVATLNMATTEVWNDKAGQRQEKTEWHRVVLWGKSGRVARRST